jgi:hypothetical protein
MPPPSHEQPTAAAQPTWADGEVVAAAVALLEAAALTAAMRRMASWNPRSPLYAAVDRRWGSAGHEDQGGWRTDRSRQAAELRLAVLVAEATISRCLAEDGSSVPGSSRWTCATLRLACRWRSVRPLAWERRWAIGHSPTPGNSGWGGRRSCDDLPYHLEFSSF